MGQVIQNDPYGGNAARHPLQSPRMVSLYSQNGWKVLVGSDWLNEGMNKKWMNEWMNEWINKKMDDWMNELMNKWINE